jgi:protein-serine/threonine kinase
VSLKHFEVLKILGRGSFGKVLLVEELKSKVLYAMKILKKIAIKSQNQKIHTRNEREILEVLDHPFLAKLHYAF